MNRSGGTWGRLESGARSKEGRHCHSLALAWAQHDLLFQEDPKNQYLYVKLYVKLLHGFFFLALATNANMRKSLFRSTK